jgi:hypothetical protein
MKSVRKGGGRGSLHRQLERIFSKIYNERKNEVALRERMCSE